MKKEESFERTVCKIALPITLQSLLQSSFSVVDQVMIGQLGSGSIAGIGIGGKFASLYSVVLAAIASAAGIMIAQYMGKKEEESAARSFYVNMALSIGLAAVFMVVCMAFPEAVMALYTKEKTAEILAVKYIRILAISFLPAAVNSIVTTVFRCMEAAALPLYVSMFALALNTGLNYLFIFGKWIFPPMGVEGAALASGAAQIISCMIILFFFSIYQKKWGLKLKISWHNKKFHNAEYQKQYLKILCPLLACEFLWSLGENVYTAIYGHIGTDACAAMTMTIPVQTVVIGALCGLSQASGILAGKRLGAKQYGRAYAEAKKLMSYGLAVSIILSLLLLAVSPFYVKLYHVEPKVQEITESLLRVIAVIAPVKVLNMILGGGIIRSGGKTKYTMWIDLIGTWIFGAPLGFLAAFVWKLPMAYVYLVLSLEECIRLGISWIVFKKKVWMGSLR